HENGRRRNVTFIVGRGRGGRDMNKVAQTAQLRRDPILLGHSEQAHPRVGAGVWARSWLFTAALAFWTALASFAFLPSLLHRRWTIAAIRFWIGGIMVLARVVVGVTYRIEGRENLPAGPCVIAAQHQSAF